MLIEQNIEFELKGLGSLAVHAVADPEDFGGGDLKPKPQKFGCLHQS